MTYIFEMASGTEYMGDEMPRPSAAKASGTPRGRADRQQVELRLATLETSPQTTPGYPAALYLDSMISKLED